MKTVHSKGIQRTAGGLPAVQKRELQSLPEPEGGYRYPVRTFNFWLEGRPITEETIRKYFSEMQRSGEYGASAQKQAKSALKKTILEAHPMKDSISFRGMITELFDTIKTPSPEIKNRSKHTLEKEQLQELVKLLPEKYGLITKALYATGARISEVLQIRLNSCRKEKEAVLCRIVGKRSKERTIVIPADLFIEIKKTFKGKEFLFESGYPAPGETKYKARPLSRSIVARHLKKAGLKIGERVHAHKFRHSRITHLRQAGERLEDVAELAGHSDPSFTAKVYSHTTLTNEKIIKTGRFWK